MLEPVPTDIDLWLVDDTAVTDAALLEHYRQWLSPGERTRHQRFIHAGDRHQFLVARALVRSVLAGYLDETDPSRLAFGANAHGKPHLTPAKRLQFNLAHTHGLVVLAVTGVNPIGVDVENLQRQVALTKLVKRYFSATEAAALNTLPATEWPQRFFDLWTLKEAYLKACGTGLKTPSRDCSFSLGDEGISISFGGDIRDDPGAWRFWQMAVTGDYRLSLAVNDPTGNTQRITVRQGIPLEAFAEVTLPILRQSG